jgi:hypothetical protein
VAATANKLLAPLGLVLRLPRYTASSHRLNLSPLTIEIGGSKARWAPLVGALLGSSATRQVEQALEGNLFDPTNCDELSGLLKQTGMLNVYWNFLGAAAPLAIGIIGQALSGSGGIDFNLGGVSTSLDDTYYPPTDFGSPGRVSNSSSAAPSSSSSPGGSAGSSGGVLPSAVATSSPPAIAAPQVSGRGVDVLTRCETSSPAGRPSCWQGRAAIGAAITGIAVIACFLADEVYRRTRRTGSTRAAG